MNVGNSMLGVEWIQRRRDSMLKVERTKKNHK
jgi:hypothetical protein